MEDSIISPKHYVWSSSTRQLEQLLDPQYRTDWQRLLHNQSWPHERGLRSPLIPPRCGFLTLSASWDENYLFGVIIFIKFYPSLGGHFSEDGAGGEIRNKYRIHCSITNGVHNQARPSVDPNTNPCSPPSSMHVSPAQHRIKTRYKDFRTDFVETYLKCQSLQDRRILRNSPHLPSAVHILHIKQYLVRSEYFYF